MTIQCPICQKELLEIELKNHIIGSSKSEVYDIYRNQGHVGLGSKGKPHDDFFRQNLKDIKTLKFTI